MSDSLRAHELQHTRLPCPSLSPWVCSYLCPLTWYCHLTIPSSVSPFSSCPQSFLTSGSFPMSCLFASGGQSIGASALASVLLMSIQGWFTLGLTGLISLQFKRLLQVISSTTVQKHKFFGTQPSLWSNSYNCTWLLEKTIALTIWSFVSKMTLLLFIIMSRFVIALPRSKCLLISWLQSSCAVICNPRK